MCDITFVMLCILYLIYRVISHKWYIPIWYITVVYGVSQFCVVYHTSAPSRWCRFTGALACVHHRHCTGVGSPDPPGIPPPRLRLGLQQCCRHWHGGQNGAIMPSQCGARRGRLPVCPARGPGPGLGPSANCCLMSPPPGQSWCWVIRAVPLTESLLLACAAAGWVLLHCRGLILSSSGFLVGYEFMVWTNAMVKSYHEFIVFHFIYWIHSYTTMNS